MVSSSIIGARGWITVEIVASLALLALVLNITQRQMTQQWQSIQQSQTSRIVLLNRQRQEAMMALTGDALWRQSDSPSEVSQYPDCQVCSGKSLSDWFRVAQHVDSVSVGAGKNHEVLAW